MPQKVTEQGCQLERGQKPGRSTSRVVQESGRSTSQKRRSQSHPQDETDSKKGRMEDGASWGRKVQVRIDWANTGIQKPVPKPDPQHPSFKLDPSGAMDSPPLPRIKSSVSARGSHWPQSQPTGHHMTTPASQESKTSKTETSKTEAKNSELSPTKYLGDPEKRKVKDKSYNWIARCMAWLDAPDTILIWYGSQMKEHQGQIRW